MTDIVTTRHDAFGRYSEVRKANDTHHRACSWCGSVRPTLYVYGVVYDDNAKGTPQWHRGVFCNKGCYKSGKRLRQAACRRRLP